MFAYLQYCNTGTRLILTHNTRCGPTPCVCMIRSLQNALQLMYCLKLEYVFLVLVEKYTQIDTFTCRSDSFTLRTHALIGKETTM